VAWDEAGEPYHRAIVWCDTRCKDICSRFSQKYGDKLKQKTGLPVSTYFTLFKILWLKENVPAIQKAIDEDKIRFGTIDSWVVYNLTGKYVTDASNASRTFLCNLRGEWDD
jgi:glycerol kinase